MENATIITFLSVTDRNTKLTRGTTGGVSGNVTAALRALQMVIHRAVSDSEIISWAPEMNFQKDQYNRRVALRRVVR